MPQLFDGVEGLHPEEVLLQGADKALGDAVALGLADEGGRALDAEEGDLVLEVARHIVGAVVMAEGETFGRVLLDGTKVAQDALAHRLECLEAVAGARGMAADALAGAVVDGNEHPGPALLGSHGFGHVGAPHDIHGGGGDGAVMGALLGAADPMRRQQAVLAHQPPDPPGRGADAGMAQPGPDLAVALAMQTRAEDLGTNVLEQLGIRAGPDRAAARRCGRRLDAGRRAMAVDRSPREAPDPGDPGQAVGAARARRDGAAHRRDLRRPKGRPPSRAAIFCSSSSLAMVTSPSLALSRSSSSSRPSRSRSFIAASAPTRARSRHSLSRATVTLSSRARVSSGSPRSRRVTAASLRRAELRRSGPAPPVGAPASAFWAQVGAPSGLSLCFWSIGLTSGCGDLYRSRLSHRTVPHPRLVSHASAPARGRPASPRRNCHAPSAAAPALPALN